MEQSGRVWNTLETTVSYKVWARLTPTLTHVVTYELVTSGAEDRAMPLPVLKQFVLDKLFVLTQFAQDKLQVLSQFVQDKLCAHCRFVWQRPSVARHFL